MIPDPEVLATNLGADTLVLIVGGERTFLVAVTGSPEIKARMIDAYREAGLPIQVAADVCSLGRPHHVPPDPGTPRPQVHELAVRGSVRLYEVDAE
jgi:hypothetical protein